MAVVTVYGGTWEGISGGLLRDLVSQGVGWALVHLQLESSTRVGLASYCTVDLGSRQPIGLQGQVGWGDLP